MTKQLVGLHVSTSGGIDKAVERAAGMGATCIQIFSGSPRMWRRTSLDKIDQTKISAAQQKWGVEAIFTHALYLVNLASDKPELLSKSAQALKHDLEFDAHIGGSGVIVHLGSHQGRGWQAVCDQLVTQIVALLKQTPQNSTFLIENSAGQKGKVTSQLSEIRWLFDEVRKQLPQSQTSRLGWCFDTCHAYAAGYHLVAGGPNNVIAEIETYKLWEDLRCVHVNESMFGLGSGRDRHANIGEGEISNQEMGQFLQLKQIKKLPLLLEVPGFDKNGPDRENLTRLIKLL